MNHRTLLTTCTAALGAAALVATAPSAHAADHHFVLTDLASFTSFTGDPALTFKGTGYVGMLDDRWSTTPGPTWAHAFDLSPAHDGRTVMQLDMAALAGQEIVSATLSFRILHGQDIPATNDFRVVGFDGRDGTLGLTWEAPTGSFAQAFGQVTNTTFGPQSIDITSIVGYSAAAGQQWLGLHLQNLGSDYFYTMTHDYPGLLSPDLAEVRIDIVTAPVPEPGTAALMAGGLAFAGWLQRRRARRLA